MPAMPKKTQGHGMGCEYHNNNYYICWSKPHYDRPNVYLTAAVPLVRNIYIYLKVPAVWQIMCEL